MSDAKAETEKRLKIAREFNDVAKKKAAGIILVGSVAYSPDSQVTEKSDLDLIVVYENLNDCADMYFKDPREQEHLQSEAYDGYLVKRKIDGVAVSIHNISLKALKKIASTKEDNLFYYRQAAKDITYYSQDFDGVSHSFVVESVPVKGLMGVKRIDPISFRRNENFVMGNDIDKILSGAIILHDENGSIAKSVDTLWDNMAKKMKEHFNKASNVEALKNADIGKFLFRKDRFTPEVREKIKEKTQLALKRIVQ